VFVIVDKSVDSNTDSFLYGVSDSNDGVIEYYSGKDLINYIKRYNVDIKGVSKFKSDLDDKVRYKFEIVDLDSVGLESYNTVKKNTLELLGLISKTWFGSDKRLDYYVDLFVDGDDFGSCRVFEIESVLKDRVVNPFSYSLIVEVFNYNDFKENGGFRIIMCYDSLTRTYTLYKDYELSTKDVVLDYMSKLICVPEVITSDWEFKGKTFNELKVLIESKKF